MKAYLQQTSGFPISTQLREMGKAVGNKIALAALREAAAPMAEAMRARLRRKTGKTARQVRVRPLRRRGYVVGVRVGLPITGKTSRYYIGRLLETGYVRRNKETGGISHIPAYPWARPGFDAAEPGVVPILEAALARGLAEFS